MQALHGWIEQLCDPDTDLCKLLQPGFEEVIGQGGVA
jgi:hypothetical protein